MRCNCHARRKADGCPLAPEILGNIVGTIFDLESTFMQRRTFLLSSAAACVAPAAFAYPAQTFSPAIWRELRTTDQVVILNYRASWSLTCQIKSELIADAIAENPAYGTLTFVDVDWDTFGRSQLTERLKVKRRSTLLVMKNGEEQARLVNEPYARQVRALLDTALSA